MNASPSNGAALAAGRARHNVERARKREIGLAYARAWHIRNKPYFDAIFGAEA